MGQSGFSVATHGNDGFSARIFDTYNADGAVSKVNYDLDELKRFMDQLSGISFPGLNKNFMSMNDKLQEIQSILAGETDSAGVQLKNTIRNLCTACTAVQNKLNEKVEVVEGLVFGFINNTIEAQNEINLDLTTNNSTIENILSNLNNL